MVPFLKTSSMNFAPKKLSKENVQYFPRPLKKDVIPVLDTGISFCKSLYYKEIDYRFKPDNDIFDTFSAASYFPERLF